MIDVTKVCYSDRWDNDTARQTELYFDFPEEMSLQLGEGQFRDAYEKVLAGIGFYDPHEIVPHMELQLICPYGECVQDVGMVSLGIGISRENTTEILDTVDLIPGKDFREEAVLQLWSDALSKEKEEVER